MRAVLLGARGAVGTVIRRELHRAGHEVTAASRTAPGAAGVDLTGDLAPLAGLAAEHHVVVNASGVERADLAAHTGPTPLVEISATGAYLAHLRARARGPVVLGAGLAPGLSTVLVTSLKAQPGDDVDVFVMLGSGEQHGPSAVAWTASLIGTDLHDPPEDVPVRNLAESRREVGPDGRTRRYLRADFPDHLLLSGRGGAVIRSYLTLSSAPMTAALGLIGRLPALRGVLTHAPHLGSQEWHLVARNRRSGERREASGSGQSEATGRLTAAAAMRAGEAPDFGAVTMSALLTVEEALAVLR